jgi:hypothetical protein
VIGPAAVSVGFDVMAAVVIAAVDQHIANAGLAHFAEGDFLGDGRHWLARLVLTLPTLRPRAS